MKNFLIAILFGQSYLSLAAHLVGGEISYQCLGSSSNGNTYEISLTLYRDCASTGAPFDNTAAIAIYGGANQTTLITTVSPSHGSITQLPSTISNPCLQIPTGVCTQKTIYTSNVILPESTHGYTVVYQRCCRNQTVNNVANPGTWGNTYHIGIPPLDTVCNSSAAFSADPPIVMCANDSLYSDFSVTELDGDSVFYSLCQPLNGGSQTNPSPNPPGSAPFTPVPYLFPYNTVYPIPSNPQISLNSSTGILTGTPTGAGQFVFAICAEEYDSTGVLLSTLRRDYQFNIVNCSLLDSVIKNPVSDTARLSQVDISFTVKLLNPGGSFQWQENQGMGWSNIINSGNYSGALGDSLSVKVDTILDGYQYRCIITKSGCLIDTSDAATLYVLNDLSVRNIPQSFEVFPNPTSNIINIRNENGFPEPSGYQIQLIDVFGRTVIDNFQIGPDIKINLDPYRIAPGAYRLIIKKNETEVVFQETIIVQ